MKKLFLLILLCLPSLCAAQSYSGASSGDVFILPPYRLCVGADNGGQACFVQSGSQIARLNGKLDFALVNKTVATLPSAVLNPGRVYRVTDGTSSSDCTGGGGAVSAVCASDGAVWGSLGGGSTPADCTSTVHGLVPTPPNNANAYLNGTCGFTVPFSITAGSKAVFASDPQWAGGVKGGAIVYCDPSWTNSSSIVTINNTTGFTDTPFTNAMIGWHVWGTDGFFCQAGGGTNLRVPLGTITSINNANSANISSTTTGLCTSTALIPSCALVISQYDDTAAMQAAWNQVVSTCGTLILPNSNMMVSAPILGSELGQCGFHNTDNGGGPGGTAVIGQGIRNTAVLLAPSFNFTTCSSDSACMFTDPAGGENGNYYRDFQINCIGGSTAGSGTRVILSLGASSVGENIGVFGCPSFSSAITLGGLEVIPAICQNCEVMNSGNSSSVNLFINSVLKDSQIYFGAGGGTAITISNPSGIVNGYEITENTQIDQTSGSSAINCTSSCTWHSHNDWIRGATLVSKPFVDLAGIATIENMNLLDGSLTNINGIKVEATGVLGVSNSNFALTGTGATGLVTVSGATLTDGCGNTNTSTVKTSIVAGTIFYPCPQGTSLAGNVVVLTGTGACGTITTQSGNGWSGKATCTGTTGASTFIITTGVTATNGWACTASDTTTANALRQSATSTSACTISGTVNANDVLTFTATPF